MRLRGTTKLSGSRGVDQRGKEFEHRWSFYICINPSPKSCLSINTVDGCTSCLFLYEQGFSWPTPPVDLVIYLNLRQNKLLLHQNNSFCAETIYSGKFPHHPLCPAFFWQWYCLPNYKFCCICNSSNVPMTKFTHDPMPKRQRISNTTQQTIRELFAARGDEFYTSFTIPAFKPKRQVE